MTDRVGVALIGAGMIAKTHVRALSDEQNHARLAAIVSRNPEKAAYLAEFYDGPAPDFTSDLAVVTGDPDIQVVIVATPPSVRIDLIETLAKAGKHILLEKPVARTTAEAIEVVEICEKYGVKLGVLFQHRKRPASILAAAHAANPQLGKLGHVEIAVPLWRDQSYYDELGRGTYARDGGGVLLTQAIHTIDLALSLTGPVQTVQAMTATTPLHQMEAEDMAVAGLTFTNGAVGSFVASTATYPHGKETITLHFENGSLLIGTNRVRMSWRDGRVEEETFDDGRVDNGPVLAKHAAHQAVIMDFIAALHADSDPIVTGRQALMSHQLITAIETSSRTGQRCDVLLR